MPKKKSHTTPEQEKERFIAAARELGCDESPEAFEVKLKAVLSAKPTTNAQIRKPRKKK